MKLQTAKGVRDFSPEEKILRQEIVDKLRRIFELYGFVPIETPILERFDILSSKYAGGAEILKETFKLTDQGGRQLGLRYDLTVPLCRFIGMNPNIKMPFKRYQIERAFRDGPIKLGRYREFWMCDVDIIGCSAMTAEAELFEITLDVFAELGFDVIIKFNNRKILNGILGECSIKKNKEKVILILDKLEKIGEKEVGAELRQIGVSSKTAERILTLTKTGKDFDETWKKLDESVNSDEGKQGLSEIKQLWDMMEDRSNLRFEPSLARGLAYYTGTVFEVFLKNSKIKSAVAAGGRYDRIIAEFLKTKKQYPAVGISFGLEPITDAMAMKSTSQKKTLTEVYVIPIKTIKQAMGIARTLRKAGINTEIDLLDRGVSKNLGYANTKGIPYVLILGENELQEDVVKLRNMESGKEQKVSIKEIARLREYMQ